MSDDDFLKLAGWREYPNRFKDARCFYKRFDSECRCQHNEDKPGIQVDLSIWNLECGRSYQLQIVGGIPDGTSVELMNYGLPKDIGEVVKLIPRLVRLWDTVAK